jgi:hypothetical protein
MLPMITGIVSSVVSDTCVYSRIAWKLERVPTGEHGSIRLQLQMALVLKPIPNIDYEAGHQYDQWHPKRDHHDDAASFGIAAASVG